MLEVYINLDRVLWQNLINDFSESGYETIKLNSSDATFSVDYFNHVINSMSLLGDKRVVFLEFDTEKDETKFITDNFIEVLSQTYLTKVFLNMRKKPLVKSKIMTVFKKKEALIHAKKDVSFNEVVNTELSQSNIKISSATKNYWLNKVGEDTVGFLKSIQIFKTLNREITKDDIDIYVPLEIDEDVFAFTNALAKKDISTIYQHINNFKRKQVDPLALIGLVSSNFRRSFQIKLLSYKGYSSEQIASFLKISDKQVYYISKNTQGSYKLYLKYLNELRIVEQGIKRGMMDKWLLFELFILNTLA